MARTDQRQSLRLVRHIPCALRVKPAQDPQAPGGTAALEDKLRSLGSEFAGYCEQIAHRPTLNALRSLQRQVEHLQSAVTTQLAQQADWTHQPQTRKVSLSFDGLEIDLLEADALPPDPGMVEVLLQIDGLPPLVCTLQVSRCDPDRLAGSFAQIADADLRRLRRYVLLQDAARGQTVA